MQLRAHVRIHFDKSVLLSSLAMARNEESEVSQGIDVHAWPRKSRSNVG